jgi:hypothetical protein
MDTRARAGHCATLTAAALISILAFPKAGQAQTAAPPDAVTGVQLPDWGEQDASIQALSAWDFEKIVEGQSWGNTGLGAGMYRYRTSNPADNVHAGVHLPSGARVTGMAIEACDTSATGLVQLVIFQCPAGSSASCTGIAVDTGGAATPGCGIFLRDLTGMVPTIDNEATSYFLAVGTTTMDTTTSFRSVRLYYKLLVSPAPVVATFSDVPLNHPFFQYVEALAASGITGGCGGGLFCPDNPLTRGQMAVFLSKALGLHWPN